MLRLALRLFSGMSVQILTKEDTIRIEAPPPPPPPLSFPFFFFFKKKKKKKKIGITFQLSQPLSQMLVF